MKNWRTTAIGFILAFCIAIQPAFTTDGYVFDVKGIGQLLIAGLIAGLGYLAKDAHES